MFKKFFALFSAMTALIFILALLPVHGESEIYDGVLRLHVLANSDSGEDQELKLFVRDEVLEYSKELLKDTKSREEAEALVASSLDEIRQRAEEAVAERGYDYSVSVTLSEEEYPTRSYESCAFPAGEYMSLQIKIGEAEGKNWWCVLYPPMCLAAASEQPQLYLQAGLGSEQYNIITQTQAPKYKIRFKLLEAFENAS